MPTVAPRFAPSDNALLAALPVAEHSQLLPHLELVRLSAGDVLCGPGVRLRHFHFPVSGVVAVLHIMLDGRTAEVAALGRDGCAGTLHLLGDAITANREVVLMAGFAYRLPARCVMQECHRAGSALHLALLRYVLSLMAQIEQTAVCNRHHLVEQQLSRWLLMSLDLTADGTVAATQELIGSMLGVQRSAITQAARKLAAAGIILYGRGVIRISDRARLEAHACECYAAIRKARPVLPASPRGTQRAAVTLGEAL